jgi:hypothetical protein
VEGFELLNNLCIGLEREFKRLDCFDVMAGLSGRAMPGGTQCERRNAGRRIKSGDESKICRYRFDF